jgi:hypothetical protein
MGEGSRGLWDMNLDSWNPGSSALTSLDQRPANKSKAKMFSRHISLEESH